MGQDEKKWAKIGKKWTKNGPRLNKRCVYT
jgi:hypothetical protein